MIGPVVDEQDLGGSLRKMTAWKRLPNWLTLRRGIGAIVACALCLGLLVAWSSLSLRFETRADTLHNLAAIPAGAPLQFGPEQRSDLPFYNRVMFPLLHKTAVRMAPGISEGQWYLLLRIFSFQAAFVAFALVCHRTVRSSTRDTVLATTLLALATVASFSFPWEETSDAFDLLAVSIGVGVALAGRFWIALAVAILFAANRESAAYLGAIWFVLNATPKHWLRPLLAGAAISVISTGATTLLRGFFGPALIMNWNTALQNLNIVAESAKGFPLNWLGLLIAVCVLFLCNIGLQTPLTWRLLALSMIFGAAGLLFGLVNELRVFLASFVMLAYAVAASGTVVPDRQRVPAAPLN